MSKWRVVGLAVLLSTGLAAWGQVPVSDGVHPAIQAQPPDSPHPGSPHPGSPHPDSPHTDSPHTDTLVITAGPGQRGVFTLETLAEYPQTKATIFDHHTNASETYSGVPLMDLLAHLGVPHGKDLHGKALAQYVLAKGSDGYAAVLALGEIDPEFHPGQVLVADAMDGKPLGATGPFRLIVTEDKRPARSVRNLVSIEVKTAE